MIFQNFKMHAQTLYDCKCFFNMSGLYELGDAAEMENWSGKLVFKWK